MADVVIYGRDCVMEILLSEVWYPIMCQSDMTFNLTQEVILKTGPNSGLFREKTTRFAEASATVSGLSPIDNGLTISVFYLLQESVRTQPQTIRLKYVDMAGSSKEINGQAVIVDTTIGAPVGDFCNSTIDFQFSGAFEVQAVTPPASGTVDEDADTWETVAGQNYISGLSTGWRDGTQKTLVGKEIIEVDREGMQYDFIGNDQTPGNRQCSWNTSLNRLVFQYNFEAGETVFVIFR